jgi:F-type H+-transporting ATPase subunit a
MKIKLNSIPSTAQVATRVLTSILLVFSFLSANASAAAEGEEFNAGEMIAHHLQDAHSIHLFGHVSIPLPVILYTDHGMDMFMSSRFWGPNHEIVPYTSSSTGNTYYLHHDEKIRLTPEHHDHPIQVAVVDTMGMAPDTLLVQPVAPVAAHGHEAGHEDHGTLVDLSITKSVLGMFIIMSLMLWVFISVAKAYNRRPGQAPKGLQNALEPLILFIKDEVAVPALGKKKALIFLPFLLTVFFFIWMCNMLGLIPLGGFNVTGTLSITLVLAALVFIITSVKGNGHYWGHIFWPPGVPLAIKFILVPIEFASLFIKPAVLMIRLTANINAGHIVILAFTSLIFIFGAKSEALGMGVGILATAFLVFMYFLELLVAFLQAYVFTLLAALYFGDATQEHHHEEHH